MISFLVLVEMTKYYSGVQTQQTFQIDEDTLASQPYHTPMTVLKFIFSQNRSEFKCKYRATCLCS